MYTISQYQKDAKRTFVELGSEQRNHLHMEMGMTTELGEMIDIFKKNLAYGKEFDKVNFAEEVGDFFWYVVNKFSIEGVELKDDTFAPEKVDPLFPYDKFEEVTKDDIHQIAIYLMKMNGAISSPNEYQSYYTDAYFMFAFFKSALRFFGYDIIKVLETNINKLKVRFPEKFTEEAAQNRNLEAERAELEKE